MTEQSTPTPPKEVEMIAVRKRVQAVIDGTLMGSAIKSAQIVLMICAAGWKSPAEVAELVRAGAEEAWKQGALWSAVEVGAIRSIHEAWLVSDDNPHSKPTTDRTEESDV